MQLELHFVLSSMAFPRRCAATVSFALTLFPEGSGALLPGDHSRLRGWIVSVTAGL